ncbi:aldehyde dehydrogenase [Cystobasidium minutum MCA 4210]|uniref:aldehyde dehydrogenase n=1 Tax=Cystobasidium minutum MCA 4210 TaxID=1397322 RepID=UPI0034CF3261|eukprot:jgi/Rhomi1/71859/CE71858_1821
MATSSTNGTGDSSLLEKKGYTPLGDLDEIHARLLKTYYSGKTKDVRWRKEQLKCLAYLVQDNMDQFTEAIRLDLGRSKNETYIVELSGILNEIIDAVHNVEKWAKPTRPKVSFDMALLKPTIYKEPKGVALIIGTWNYAVTLALGPMIGAISAGCPAVLKCSEVTTHTGALMANLIPKYLDQDAYAVVLGEVHVITRLLEMQWAHIFYTGNAKVARIIAAAAAKHLTPMTLELGGKSPCFIDPSLKDLNVAAKRILWGKRVNCGQTCISPDYVIVTRDQHPSLLLALQKEYARIFPSTFQDLSKDDYPRIASVHHFDRLKKMIENSQGKVVLQGQMDRESKLMGITVLDEVAWDDAVMQEEIFGPILPIVVVDSVDEALQQIRPQTPLALYVFSQSDAFISKIRSKTQSGAFIVNDVMLHFNIGELPFGGVGESGTGSYHGKKSFDTFTHERSSMTTPFWADFLTSVRYYPYTDRNKAIFQATQAKKINFNRPSSIASLTNGSPSANTSAASKVIKYALLAVIVALASRKLSWIVALIPKYKVVKVE